MSGIWDHVNKKIRIKTGGFLTWDWQHLSRYCVKIHCVTMSPLLWTHQIDKGSNTCRWPIWYHWPLLTGAQTKFPDWASLTNFHLSCHKAKLQSSVGNLKMNQGGFPVPENKSMRLSRFSRLRDSAHVVVRTRIIWIHVQLPQKQAASSTRLSVWVINQLHWVFTEYPTH